MCFAPRRIRCSRARIHRRCNPARPPARPALALVRRVNLRRALCISSRGRVLRQSRRYSRIKRRGQLAAARGATDVPRVKQRAIQHPQQDVQMQCTTPLRLCDTVRGAAVPQNPALAFGVAQPVGTRVLRPDQTLGASAGAVCATPSRQQSSAEYDGRDGTREAVVKERACCRVVAGTLRPPGAPQRPPHILPLFHPNHLPARATARARIARAEPDGQWGMRARG